MEKRQKNQRLARERAVYNYLEALENGDIDGLIETLQQAVYDAPLDEMLVDTHYAYFQNGEIVQDELAEVDTRVDLPAYVPLAPRALHGEQRARRRRFPLWTRALAAVLIMAVLIGSFVTLQALYRANAHHTNVIASPAVCQASSWQLINTSVAGTLFATAASSPVNAWAVGETDKLTPLITHWDGQQWREVSSPQPPSKEGYLETIAIVTPNDIWAAGEQFKANLFPSRHDIETEVPGSISLIEHWDGKNWTIVASPDNKAEPQFAVVWNAMTVVSAHDIWLVGVRNNSYFGSTQDSLVEHWDGQKWTRIQDQGHVLEDGTSAQSSVLWTSTVAGDQVLAGGTQIGSDGGYHAYLERWDGRQWQQVDIRSLGQNASAIFSVSAVSPNDIWAIVQLNRSEQPPDLGGATETAMVHWDGQTWKQVSAPSWLVGRDGHTVKILALSSTNVWAMNDNDEPSLLAHWDGTSWHEIRLPTLILNLYVSPSDFAVSAGAVWVVGERLDATGDPFHPLFEQAISCP